MNKDVSHIDNALISPNNSFNVMSIMLTNTTSLEEQVAKMSKIVEALTNSIKEKDDKFTSLMKKVDGLTEKRDVVTDDS